MTARTATVPGGHSAIDRLAFRLARLTGWRRALASFVLGCLATLAMPPVLLLPILYVCFPALIWMLSGCQGRRQAFALGWYFAFGYFLVGLYWINNAFLVFAGQYWFMVPLIGIGFPAFLGIFGGLATVLADAARGPLARVLALAAAWAALEWVRGHVLTGFAWNFAGHAWLVSDGMIQSAAAIGIYGTSLLALVSCCLLAGLKNASWWARLAVAAVALAIPAGAHVVGNAYLETAGGRTAAATVGVRVVQANIPQKEKWRRDLRERNFRRHLEMSAKGRPDWVKVVIWPETATPFYFEESPAGRGLAAQMLPEDGVLLTGTPRRRTNPPTLWNGMVAMDKSGAIRESFNKFHLVPLGEYVPLSQYLPLPAIAASGIDYSPGPGPRTLHVGTLPPFSPLICYEVIFPGRVVDRADPPDWFLNLTNDAWYGESAGPYQHLAMARIRAVEEGIPMVRAANTGISAVVDPFGRILDSVPLSEPGVIDIRLPGPLAGRTPYSKYGDIPFALLLLTVVLAVLGLSRVNRR